jgi:hypothetical protein
MMRRSNVTVAGAGVGKGRQIAGLIKQHWNDGGRRALWVSVSADLRHDAARDLSDVKAGDVPICPRVRMQCGGLFCAAMATCVC